jgi:hypothetical protein
MRKILTVRVWSFLMGNVRCCGKFPWEAHCLGNPLFLLAQNSDPNNTEWWLKKLKKSRCPQVAAFLSSLHLL